MASVPDMVFLRVQDQEGATATLVRGAEVPGMAFWHYSGSSRRNNQIDQWRWNPENDVLACFKVFKRLSSNEATPSMNMNRYRGL
eukprot:4517335-Pyramimonas_sp.AAC.1